MSDIALDPAVVPPPAAPARTAPLSQIGLVGWLRANLFNSWLSTAVTLLLAYFIVKWAAGFIDWAFLHAVWSVPATPQGTLDPTPCRDAKGVGACWAVVGTCDSCLSGCSRRITRTRKVMRSAPVIVPPTSTCRAPTQRTATAITVDTVSVTGCDR